MTFFRLCDQNKNGKVSWNEFWAYKQKYTYAASADGDDFDSYVSQLKRSDKDTFIWLASGAFGEENHKGYFTWDDVRSRFTY